MLVPNENVRFPITKSIHVDFQNHNIAASITFVVDNHHIQTIYQIYKTSSVKQVKCDAQEIIVNDCL